MREKKQKKENAYLTVYMTLSLAALLSLCLLLIEGVRRNGAALETSCAADVGMQSILAEYHRELLEQYNLFAIDSSYGTAICGRKNTEAHLYHYLEKNLQSGRRDLFSLRITGAELTGVSILTDGNGSVFRACAVEAIRDDVGLELLEEVQNWVETVKRNDFEEADMEWEKQALDKEIAEYESLKEGAGKVENPTGELNEMRRQGILKLVLADEQELSEKRLATENLIESRMAQERVNRGNLEGEWEESLADRFLFREYLLRYFGCYGREKKEGALEYQLEYLLVGEDTDMENLRSVAGRLCALREAANASYLFSDQVKSGEAEALAATICTALLVPELTPVLHASIILGWAYAESLHDVKMLFAGKKIPLLKDGNSWYLGLENALAGEVGEDADVENGLSYEDYLRIFMMLAKEETLTLRSMNMAEADIRRTPGNEAFRLDACYVQVEARMNMTGGDRYAFELIRTKRY